MTSRATTRLLLAYEFVPAQTLRAGERRPAVQPAPRRGDGDARSPMRSPSCMRAASRTARSRRHRAGDDQGQGEARSRGRPDARGDARADEAQRSGRVSASCLGELAGPARRSAVSEALRRSRRSSARRASRQVRIGRRRLPRMLRRLQPTESAGPSDRDNDARKLSSSMLPPVTITTAR